MSEIKAGDKMNYLPDECHALQARDGADFPWDFGWKNGKEVVPLTAEEVRLKLRHIRRQSPDRAAKERGKLVLLRPREPWQAVVRKVNVDGSKVSLDLTINDPTTGAKLNYDAVPLDAEATKPHTCHVPS